MTEQERVGEEVECRPSGFYDDAMAIEIEVATLGPEFEALVNKLAKNGGEVSITRDGEIVAKLVIFEKVSAYPAAEADVCTTGDG
ncbi:MAG TPA: hypothetical protein VHX14_00705 [Thermoanaerobaculia bacterium]|nr:hypothetical protein [Thermoanaerobaculia bacterium]